MPSNSGSTASGRTASGLSVSNAVNASAIFLRSAPLTRLAPHWHRYSAAWSQPLREKMNHTAGSRSAATSCPTTVSTCGTKRRRACRSFAG